MDFDRFGDDRGPHLTAPLFVLSHCLALQMAGCQPLIMTGIVHTVAAAREAAGDKDVALMSGGVVTEALRVALVDEPILHQVPVMLGAGRVYFQEVPEHIQLRLVEVVPAPGVTHRH